MFLEMVFTKSKLLNLEFEDFEIKKLIGSFLYFGFIKMYKKVKASMFCFMRNMDVLVTC